MTRHILFPREIWYARMLQSPLAIFTSHPELQRMTEPGLEY